jgi:site-specific DNA-cytosine methylase
VSNWDRTSACGDAVPPPLAKAVVDAVAASGALRQKTAVEICAGAGGLASAAAGVGLEHLGLFEKWLPAVRILQANGEWRPEAVHRRDVREIDWSQFRVRLDFCRVGRLVSLGRWQVLDVEAQMSGIC